MKKRITKKVYCKPKVLNFVEIGIESQICKGSAINTDSDRAVEISDQDNQSDFSFNGWD